MKSAGSVVNGDIDAPDGSQPQQEADNYTAIDGNTIKNDSNTSHASQMYDVPTGDTETLRTGKTIVRCSRGSDWWRCTADKCRMKGDIYMMRSHVCIKRPVGSSRDKSLKEKFPPTRAYFLWFESSSNYDKSLKENFPPSHLHFFNVPRSTICTIYRWYY